MYSVPQNKTLFITSAFIALGSEVPDAASTISNQAEILIQNAVLNTRNVILASYDSPRGSGNANVSVSFPMPIRVLGNQDIKLLAVLGGSEMKLKVGFTGWEEDKAPTQL